MTPESSERFRAGKAQTGPSAGRVLFLAQLPPPRHGQSAMAEIMYGIFKHDAGFDIVHKWRGGARDIHDIGKRRIAKYIGSAGLIIELALMALLGRRFALVYLGMVPWAFTALRDALLVHLAKRLGSRTWVHVHGDGLDQILNGSGLKNRLMRRLLSGTEIIAITSDTARIASRASVFRRVIELPNMAFGPGIANTSFTPPLTIGCLGNLYPRKGFLEFIDVTAALISDGIPVRAVIVGRPTPLLTVEALRSKAAALGIADHVVITGWINEQARNEILADLDIFFHLSRHDLAPVALIEAMSHACVPIVLDVGGMLEMVGSDLSDNVLNPKQSKETLTGQIKSIVAGYNSDMVRLEGDKKAARARYSAEYCPHRFRERVLGYLFR